MRRERLLAHLANLVLLGYLATAHLAEESEVSLADGTRKRLKEIRLGDQVQSYDEGLRGRAPSTVVAIFESWLPVGQIVQISLPGASLWTSAAHPVWSSTRGSVVSLSPNVTQKEYGLVAGTLVSGELLEDEQQRPVSTGTLQVPAQMQSRRLGGAGRVTGASPAPLMRVLTLGLEPHHWFYAENVRVHNKGCFLADAAVTLADGTRRPLGQISVGEAVASWDEVAQRPAVAQVRARPSFQRRQEELVRIELWEGSRAIELLATEDHPLWSRSRRQLVSLRPNSTREAYGLPAELLQLADELEGEALQALPVLGLRRPFPSSSSAPALVSQGPETKQAEGADSRSLRGGTSLGGPAEGLLEVQTLCLEPHHWFYVEGVRVHNKGCFAPWTPIMMADGQQKPLEAVVVNDQVLSWDEQAGRPSVANVSAVEEFPARDLLEISILQQAASRLLRSGSASGSGSGSEALSLVLTRDHPVYSARARGMVSMDPLATLQRYGLQVGQMQPLEFLQQHDGLTVEASVGNWSRFAAGELSFSPRVVENISRVMTLRLEGHHWFFARGVRVHNKGGGGGGGGGGGVGGGVGGGSSSRTASSMGVRSYATFIILSGGSRRRYGTYHQEEGCAMRSDAEVATMCHNHVTERCPSFDETCCHDCLACDSEACMDSIGGCEDFLAGSFESCQEEVSPWVGVIMGALVGGCCAVGCCYMKFSKNEGVSTMTKARGEMQVDQGTLPQFLTFSGTYSENGETKSTTYQLSFRNGLVSGTGIDDDGQAQVQGKVCLPEGALQGQIRWQETRPGVTIEFGGSLAQTAPGTFCINGTYRSSYQSTVGTLALASAAQGVQVPVPGTGGGNCAPVVCPIVVGHTVVPGEVH